MKEIHIRFRVNGKEHVLLTDPLRPLSGILRENLLLTGTKEGCHKGECGACTVIMNNRTVDSCLVPACHADQSEIITIEGIGGETHPHPAQKAFLREGAVQCGFCTPGFIMSTVDLLNRNPDPDEELIRESLSGNLCRCTGYAKILKAVRRASRTKKRMKKPQ